MKPHRREFDHEWFLVLFTGTASDGHSTHGGLGHVCFCGEIMWSEYGHQASAVFGIDVPSILRAAVAGEKEIWDRAEYAWETWGRNEVGLLRNVKRETYLRAYAHGARWAYAASRSVLAKLEP